MNLSLLFDSVRLATPFFRKGNLHRDAVTLSLVALGFTAPAYQVSAQAIPIPDNTLGAESSQINSLGANSDRIDGGALRGNNLFHSFLEFNIADSHSVYFASPGGVDNIFSRITGGAPSEIFGTLGVDGTASLFLLNPNGILFGPNANLDINGSFIATTADAIQFEDQGFFSAQTPISLPLLNIQPSALLFNQLESQRGSSIRNEGELSVASNESLFLVGGNILLDGGQLNAPDGRVELASISEGRVGLAFRSGSLNLIIPDDLDRTDIALLNGSQIDVQGTGLGSIALYAEDLEISGGSQVLAGIATTPSSLVEQSGDITIDTTGSLSLSGAFVREQGWNRSAVSNTVAFGAEGDAGDIYISTRSLEVTRGAEINTSVRGQGNAGDITITALESLNLLSGKTQDGRFTPSRVRSGVEGSATAAQGGNIEVNTDSLRITDGAYITATSNGQGDAGTIAISAQNIEILGEGVEFASGVYSQVFNGGNGQAGNIVIRANSLALRDGGILVTNNSSSDPEKARNAGNITIEAQIVLFEGERDNPGRLMHSGAYARIEPNGIGNAGTVAIQAEELYLDQGGLIATSVDGEGNAGNIFIQAPLIRLSNVSKSQLIASGIYSRVRDRGNGRGGNIVIDTEDIKLSGGSVITTDTRSSGDAGSITINAERVEIEGRGQFPTRSQFSALASTVDRIGIGQGGNIQVNTDALIMTDGGQISTGTAGRNGNAGNIIVVANDYIQMSGFGSAILSENGNTQGIFDLSDAGNVGSITIRTGRFEVNDDVVISTASIFSNAGNISVDARDIQLTDSDVISVSLFASGGNIELTANRVTLFGDSNLGTFSGSGGRGGNVIIQADTVLAFDDSDILAFALDGQGGNVTLNTRAFFGENYQPSQDEPLTFTVDALNRSISFALDGNDRVDINASGAVSGVITIPDVSFIENSLTALPDVVIDTEQLIAGSCIARTDTGGSFVVSGRGGLPDHPSDTFIAPYATGSVLPLPADGSAAVEDNSTSSWQPGDPIVEPEGLFQLPDGRLVASRTCSFN